MRKVTLPKIEQQELVQEIISLSISFINRTAEVGYAFGNEDETGKFIPIPTTIVYEQVDYDELMAEHPEWSPSKPAGEFRMDDVFQVLDRKHEALKAQKADKAKREKKQK